MCTAVFLVLRTQGVCACVISKNQLSFLPNWLAHFTQLTKLYIWFAPPSFTSAAISCIVRCIQRWALQLLSTDLPPRLVLQSVPIVRFVAMVCAVVLIDWVVAYGLTRCRVFSHHQLTSLPDAFGNLSQLVELDLWCVLPSSWPLHGTA